MDIFGGRGQDVDRLYTSELPSVLRHCWLSIRKSIWPVKIEWCGVGVFVWCEQGADCLDMVQLMLPHPQTPSSLASIKSRLVLAFWYRLTQAVLEKRLGVVVVVVVYRYYKQLSQKCVIILSTQNYNLRRWKSSRYKPVSVSSCIRHWVLLLEFWTECSQSDIAASQW